MGRASRGQRAVLQAAITCALYLYGIESVIGKTKIPPPANLKVELVNMFVVNWTWEHPEHLTSNTTCEFIYESALNSKKVRSRHINRTEVPPDLNKETCFEVKAICENVGESDWLKLCSYFLKGYPETLVRDFKWTWNRGHPLESTWNYQKSAVPEANYTLYYMYNELCRQRGSSGEVPEGSLWTSRESSSRRVPALESPNGRYVKGNEIRECQEYVLKEGIVHGCKFSDTFYSGERINILVTDSSLKLGRFYSSLEPITILRPGPPNITVTKLSIDRIHVKWNDTEWHVKDYEVQSKDSKSQTWTTYTITGKNNCIIDSAQRDVMYTVRVKAKFDENYGGVLWSNWSAEASVGEHCDDDWTVRYILLITIPLIAAIATILLLVFLKRLKILICPPIPDPSKMFRDIIGGTGEEFQQWIKKSPMMAPNKPVQEETCSVILVEKETSAGMPPC